MPRIFTFMFEGGEGTIGFLVGIFCAYTIIPVIVKFMYNTIFFCKSEHKPVPSSELSNSKTVSSMGCFYNSPQRKSIVAGGGLEKLMPVTSAEKSY
jgi:hypothetical protein